jgi:hypothetical protein
VKDKERVRRKVPHHVHGVMPVPAGHWRCVCGEDWYLRVWHCKDCGYVRMEVPMA